MSEKTKRFHKRPLLVAGLGVAVISIAACGGFTSGNLMAPRCPDGGFDVNGDDCMPAAKDGGTADAGVKDAGLGGDT